RHLRGRWLSHPADTPGQRGPGCRRPGAGGRYRRAAAGAGPERRRLRPRRPARQTTGADMNRVRFLFRGLLAMSLAIAPLAGVRAQGAQALVGTTPALSIATLGGGTFDLAAQRGKWVVLNWWATWCTPCIREIPEVNGLARRDDVVVLVLDFEEIDRADLDAFLSEHPIHYAVAPVDVYEPPAAFPVPRGLPLTYVIDPQGVVAKVFLGPVTRAELEQVIDATRRGNDR